MTDKPNDFDVGAEFDKIFESQEANAPAIDVVTEPVAEPAPEGSDRSRDEHGRFVRTTPERLRTKGERAVDMAEAMADVAEKRSAATPEAEEAAKDAPETGKDAPPAPEAPEAPAMLPKAIREGWKELKPEIRDAIEKREADFHVVATRVDRERSMGRSFDSAIEEYKPIITAEGGTPIAAVRDLLETARVLRQGSPEQKAHMLNLIASRFDIDIEQAYHARPAPEVAATQLALNRANAELSGYRNIEAAQASMTAEQHVAAFAADKPHFDSVAPRMEQLIRSGAAGDLQEAYNLAIAADDKLRSASIEDAVAKRLAEEEAKQSALVAKARRAAVSPPSASGNAKPPGSANLNPREAMELEYERIMASASA